MDIDISMSAYGNSRKYVHVYYFVCKFLWYLVVIFFCTSLDAYNRQEHTYIYPPTILHNDECFGLYSHVWMKTKVVIVCLTKK